ncbi:acetylornithine deacetylase [Salinisphaera sp.]|uniref:acetylornithine deacetylase n=1 Tax=Salinisphaera sp. TaxID=1914330 RepID=UPI002D784186|nr:acetylornithine deacetylase [Salinisphaera sp.]HET7314546.1 acetylornithine deacetylase [Salinisphaera sp.]
MPKLNWRDTLTELIAEPTVSSDDPALDHGNRRAVEALAERLDGIGFACDIQPIGEREDKVNLIAHIGPDECDAGSGLVFAGHIDTVPYDHNGWDSDPFSLTERDDRLYGLGTTDMKGFVALAAGVAAEYADRPLQAPLSLVVTGDEECGMDGARALAASGVAPGRYCVIGEPTSMVPIRRHKGIFMETIETRGATGHSSNPAHGANAIEAMYRATGAVRELRDELAGREPVAGFSVPHPTLNLGAIRGGDAANRIPARCRLDIDLRFLPGDSIDGLRNELRRRIRAALAESDCEVRFSALFAGTPALETPADSPIVTACETLTGHEAAAVDFGTEGAFYNDLGMDTVILGPGDIALAHQPNEYLALDRIAPMQSILRDLVQRFCRPG